jgi:ribonuclease P protein component
MTAGDLDSSLLGRIVRPADYVRVLATPMRLRSPHFAVHHVDGRPLPLKYAMPRDPATPAQAAVPAGRVLLVSAPVTASLSTELSTGPETEPPRHVDDLQEPGPAPVGETPIDAPSEAHAVPAVEGRWLGLVVPKRHAKRAVTRTLVKRQIRTVVADCAARLAPGIWVVRQRSPFDPKAFPSAASEALREAVRTELRALFERAARGERDRVKPYSKPAGAPAGRARPAKAPTAAKTPSPPATPEGSPCAA